MSIGRIDVVLVRLGAIAVVVSAIYQLAGYGSYFFEEGVSTPAQIGMVALTLLVPVGIATVLWKFPATVVSRVSPELHQEGSTLIEPEELMVVGTALLGLYTFVSGALEVLYSESLFVWERSLVDFYQSDPYHSPPNLLASRLTSYAEVVFGVVLIFGRRGIARLILNVRGRRSAPDSD